MIEKKIPLKQSLAVAIKFYLFYLSQKQTLKYFIQNPDSHNIKQLYDKGKQRNHSSVGCKHLNFYRTLLLRTLAVADTISPPPPPHGVYSNSS